MFCSKCGNELKENDIFCNKCGEKVVKEQQNNIGKVDKSNNEYTEPIKEQTNRKVVKTIFIGIIVTIILYVGFTGFWFLVNGALDVHFAMKAIIIIIGIGLTLKEIMISMNNSYQGKCPYCDSNIRMIGEAGNCPICQKRIIVKDDKFYKV